MFCSIKLCFGNKTNLFRHFDVLSKVKQGERGYNKKISREVFGLVERNAYEVDACAGMTILEWEFPGAWSWNNMSLAKGFIHYSEINKGTIRNLTNRILNQAS